MTDSYIQVRTSGTDKEKASEILEKMGTNLSAVINMLIKQIIETESIPFEIKTHNKKEDECNRIREMVAMFSPGDTIELALHAKNEEDRIFYERLGDYILRVSQDIAIERNLF